MDILVERQILKPEKHMDTFKPGLGTIGWQFGGKRTFGPDQVIEEINRHIRFIVTFGSCDQNLGKMYLSAIRFSCLAIFLVVTVGCSTQDRRTQVDNDKEKKATEDLLTPAAEEIDTLSGEDVETIRTFYRLYVGIWAIPPAEISPTLFEEKLDSLSVLYCTNSLRVKAREYRANGLDLITGNWLVMGPTMRIARDPWKENSFVVTFDIDVQQMPGTDPQKKKVQLHVQLLKELDVYKLDSVMDIDD